MSSRAEESQLQYNLRHLRVFLAVIDTASVTRAAEICHVSQPAVTQSLAKLERGVGMPLFARSTQGLFANRQGDALATRVRRALQYLDPALSELGPRLRLTATTAQLHALIAVREMENFTLAARRLGLAQPTVHRAVTQLEQDAARPLFERTSYGIVATRASQLLVQAARLAFAELAQVEADLAETISEEAGRIVIGAMPLSRSYVLPGVIAAFRKHRPRTPIQVLEGPYNDLLAGLRRGEIDFLIGALRSPQPIGDVEQRELFTDTLVLLAGKDHPLSRQDQITLEDLASFPWVVAQCGTPIRNHFDALFASLGRMPDSIVESGSVILMRELLNRTEHLGCISMLQADAELARGLVTKLQFDLDHTARPIGLTLRTGWMPTAAQELFLKLVQQVGREPEEALMPV